MQVSLCLAFIIFGVFFLFSKKNYQYIFLFLEGDKMALNLKLFLVGYLTLPAMVNASLHAEHFSTTWLCYI
jgi:multisubunit Na+/H+ antiporter MnhC subunit